MTDDEKRAALKQAEAWSEVIRACDLYKAMQAISAMKGKQG